METFNAIVVRIIADGLVVPIVLIGAWVMFKIPRDKWVELFSKAFVTGLVALTFAKIGSLVYQGDRPFVLLGTQPGALYLDNPGFPSDHALLIFTITFVVWASTRNKKITLLLLLMSILVGLGRISALVHSPIDVFGGFFFAALAAYTVYGSRILPRLRFRRSR